MPYFVYILECENSSFYIGYTNDLERRFQAHCEGRAAKYTRSFKPKRIAAHWEFGSKSEAMKTEAKLKQLSRQQKEQLVSRKSVDDAHKP